MSRQKNKANGKGKEKKRKEEKYPSISDDQSYTDFLCPICLQILIKPVQLPCRHELCMECFKMHVENTSLQCPMCRLRISIWVRKNTKNNSLINNERWDLIRSLFPERVARRLNGQDDLESSYNEYNAPRHVIAPEGDLRKEYEEEIRKINEEEAITSKANIEYIKKLQEEDAENRHKQEEMDKAAARALQEEEMNNLGVTLRSPSSHQKALLALWKPKSPMKLRDKKVIDANKQAGSSKCKKIKFDHTITSPKQCITSFFRPSTPTNSQETYLSPSTIPTSKKKIRTSPRFSSTCTNTDLSTLLGDQPTSSTMTVNIVDIDRDFEFARKLQERFNQELDIKSSPVKKPLVQRNKLSPNLKSNALTHKKLVKPSKNNKQENVCRIPN